MAIRLRSFFLAGKKAFVSGVFKSPPPLLPRNQQLAIPPDGAIAQAGIANELFCDNIRLNIKLHSRAGIVRPPVAQAQLPVARRAIWRWRVPSGRTIIKGRGTVQRCPKTPPAVDIKHTCWGTARE